MPTIVTGFPISRALLERLQTKLAAIRMLFRSREEIYQDACEGRQFNFVYFAMLVFACLIALLGLLLNSPAVIIGAMLISPLMGPILSCGLALTLADWDLGTKAAKNSLLSIGETIVIAALAAAMSPLKDATPEILARTTPNLMDLLIAFFSGLAGTLALSSRKGGLTILPGVAIATAVMPPLATVGYGLSTRQWHVAGGAFMLFFTNFTAIVISADLVFLLIGFRPKQLKLTEKHSVFVRWRIAIASVVLLALSIPLLRTLLGAAQQARIRREVAIVLHEQFDRPGRRLASMDIKAERKSVLVDSAVQTERFIEPHEINSAEAAIAARLRAPARLIVQQVQLAHEITSPPVHPTVSSNDFVAGGVVRPEGAPEFAQAPAETLSRMQDKVQSILHPLLSPAGVRQLTVNSLGVETGGKLRVDVSAQEATMTDDLAWKVASAALGKELKADVRIIATLEMADVSAFDIRFGKNSSQASATELKKMARFLNPWKDRANVRSTLLTPSQGRPELIARRISSLRPRFQVESVRPADPAATLNENAIRLKLVQVVDVDGSAAPMQKTTESE